MNTALQNVASSQEEATAIAAELAAAGVRSLEELAEQAATGEFVSERARRAWFTLAPLDGDWGPC